MKRSHLDKMNQESDRPVEIIGYLPKTTSTKKEESEEYTSTLGVLDLLTRLPEDILEKARTLISWKRLYHNGKISNLDRIELIGKVDGDFTKSTLPEQVTQGKLLKLVF